MEGLLGCSGTCSNLTKLFDYQGGTNPIYLGSAKPGTATSASLWSIKQFSYDASGDVTAIKYASGSGNATFIWDNRTGYSYS